MLLKQDSSTPRHGTYSKAYPRQTHWHRPYSPPVGCLLLLASIMLVAAVGGRVLLARAARQPVRYALVIDSGSSGTRMYAYNWTQPHSRSSSSKPFPVVRAIPPSAAPHLVPKHATKGMYSRVETRPGLDVFAGNSSGLPGAIEPLLAWARAVVPKRHHPTTPLFFMGTGGLRRLSTHQQQPLLDAIMQLLGQSGFMFEPDWARVISGDDEGAFGWLALNYQQGRLRLRSSTATEAASGSLSSSRAAGRAAPTPTSTSITSLGALDMGGSSLQITFEVQPAAHSSSSGSDAIRAGSSDGQTAVVHPPSYNVSVSGHTFHLHLHSFQQYGLNEAYDRAVTVLLQQQHQHHQQEQQQHKSNQQVGDGQQHQQGAKEQQQQMSASTSTSGVAAGSSEPAVTSSNVTAPTSNDNTLLANSTAAESTYPLHKVVAAAVQHDTAVAGAAGVVADAQPLPDVAAPVGTASDSQHTVALAEQQQADLAAAAAAGLQPHELLTPDDNNNNNSSSSSSSRDSSTSEEASEHSSQYSSTLPQGTSSHMPLLRGDSSGGSTYSPGLPLQASSAAVLHTGVAGRRQRRSLLQHKQMWVQQLLGSTADSTSAPAPANHSSSSSSRDSSDGHIGQQNPSVRFRQLLRQFLLRDDPALTQLAAPAATNTTTTTTATTTSSSSSAVGSPAHITAAPHPVVRVDAGSSSSGRTSAVVPTREQQQQAAGQATGDTASAVSAGVDVSSNSSVLPVVQHPCLHKGYEAVYTRVAYKGVAPQPLQVVLRGAPDWEACLRLVDVVVNASAPCAVEEHRPSCLLGTPQPELQGNFMALTGFYVVSRFLGVQGSRSLEPLLDAAQTLCGRTWSWVQHNLGSNVNVERYCTWGPYVVKLLLHGLGLEEQQVLFAQDGGLGWPLGAVLVEASKLPGYGTSHDTGPAKGQQQGRHRMYQHSSLRGTGVLQHEVQDTKRARSKSHSHMPSRHHQQPQPHTGDSHSTLTPQHQPQPQPAAHGPPWSLGLLHHNQSPSTGVHLSGPGWVSVLGVVWCLIVAWCRCMWGPKASGPAFLPLALGPIPTGPGRAHNSAWPPRGKISPNRNNSFFKLGSSR